MVILRGWICPTLVLVYAVVGFHSAEAQIFIGDSIAPGILYAPLPKPRDDTDIMDTRFTLISLPDNTRIDGIDFDPDNEMVYWNDFINDQISRIQLDGTNREVIIPTNSPDGIALDLVNGKIYWTLYNDGGISRANLDGSSVEDLFAYSSFVQPTSILVDPVSGLLIWSTRIVNQVVTAMLNATNQEIVKDIYAQGMINELCADDTTRLFYYTNYSAIGVINLDSSEDKTIRVFPTPASGSALSKYGTKLFWSAEDPRTSITLIYEYDLRGATLKIHNATVTLTNGSTITINPQTTRIISDTAYNEPVAIQGCPDNIIVIPDGDATSMPVSWAEPSLNSWSSCPQLDFLGPGTNGGNFEMGTTDLSYRASDAAGNTDVCQFTVTVQRHTEVTSTPDPPLPDCHDDDDDDDHSGSGRVMSSFYSILRILFIALLLLIFQ